MAGFADNDPVQRVSVVGNSGSGKTTFAAELARRIGAPHLELDSVFHQADWEPLPAEKFRARVAAFTAGDRWVVDGNYSRVLDLVWPRADTVVWLDPPRHRVMRRIVWRTLRRVFSRAELWNGNREPWGNLFRVDPEKSVVAWAWTRYPIVRQRYAQAQADPANGHLDFIRASSDRDAVAVLDRARADLAGRARPEGG
jgi:adenylate kinase family enzyme